jgi:hypothetical protein
VKPTKDNILPHTLDKKVHAAVAEAVGKAALRSEGGPSQKRMSSHDDK